MPTAVTADYTVGFRQSVTKKLTCIAMHRITVFCVCIIHVNRVVFVFTLLRSIVRCVTVRLYCRRTNYEM